MNESLQWVITYVDENGQRHELIRDTSEQTETILRPYFTGMNRWREVHCYEVRRLFSEDQLKAFRIDFQLSGQDAKLLERPLTRQELMRLASGVDQPHVCGIIKVKLSQIANCDYERYLDILSESVIGSTLLTEMKYNVVGVEADGDTLLMKVCGNISEALEEFASCES